MKTKRIRHGVGRSLRFLWWGSSHDPMRLNFPARHLLMLVVYAIAALAPASLCVFILAMLLFRLNLFGSGSAFGVVASVTYLLAPLLLILAIAGVGLSFALGMSRSGPELSQKDITP